jgi:signal transduction histidine kinase/ActR/RegA family two-component response regulator
MTSYPDPRGWIAAACRAIGSKIRCGRGRALRRARRQARQAEARLREAIDLLPEGLVFLDAEGRYILWNRAYAEIYRRSADLFAPGRRLVDTLRVGVARGDYPDAVGREEDWIAERMARMRNPGVRHEQQLADGRWLMIEERATSDGGLIGLRVDITEMKRQADALAEALARAEAASRAKSEFLANMSHEIRTPLNGVLGLATVLERTSLDDRQRDLVRTIVASANTLDALLSDLLTFARLESGRTELAREPFALHEAVREAVRLFEPQAEAKGLGLELAVSPEAAAEVLGDAGRLKQVVVNLVSNAVKFTAEGRIRVGLGRQGEGEAARFVLEVSDTGIGFEPADAERLFLRFEQADGSITRRFGGTGLGLAICRQLTELMGGTIRAEGAPGQGARFIVELPLPPAGPAAEPAPAAEASPARGLRVLVAEDNPTNRKVAELMLASAGAAVACVENGLQALEALGADAYDLVLMDLQMPVMDGLSALKVLREREAAEGRPRTPVVVLSANVMPEHVDASRAAGADGHIGKPIRAGELLAALAHARSADPAAPEAPDLRDAV